jgi:hypothetical protein
MSTIPTQEFAGDLSVNRNVNIGGDASILRGSMTIAHDLKVGGWLEAKNVKSANKGLFATYEDLLKAYPEPRDGWFAGVSATDADTQALGLTAQEGKALFRMYVGKGSEWVCEPINKLYEITVDKEQVTNLNASVNDLTDRVDAQDATIERIETTQTANTNTLNVHTTALNTHMQLITAHTKSIDNLDTRLGTAETGITTLFDRVYEMGHFSTWQEMSNYPMKAKLCGRKDISIMRGTWDDNGGTSSVLILQAVNNSDVCFQIEVVADAVWYRFITAASSDSPQASGWMNFREYRLELSEDGELTLKDANGNKISSESGFVTDASLEAYVEPYVTRLSTLEAAPVKVLSATFGAPTSVANQGGNLDENNATFMFDPSTCLLYAKSSGNAWLQAWSTKARYCTDDGKPRQDIIFINNNRLYRFDGEQMTLLSEDTSADLTTMSNLIQNATNSATTANDELKQVMYLCEFDGIIDSVGERTFYSSGGLSIDTDGGGVYFCTAKNTFVGVTNDNWSSYWTTAQTLKDCARLMNNSSKRLFVCNGLIYRYNAGQLENLSDWQAAIDAAISGTIATNISTAVATGKTELFNSDLKYRVNKISFVTVNGANKLRYYGGTCGTTSTYWTVDMPSFFTYATGDAIAGTTDYATKAGLYLKYAAVSNGICTFYHAKSDALADEAYVHTDNNFTDDHVAKLANLPVYAGKSIRCRTVFALTTDATSDAIATALTSYDSANSDGSDVGDGTTLTRADLLEITRKGWWLFDEETNAKVQVRYDGVAFSFIEISVEAYNQLPQMRYVSIKANEDGTYACVRAGMTRRIGYYEELTAVVSSMNTALQTLYNKITELEERIAALEGGSSS